MGPGPLGSRGDQNIDFPKNLGMALPGVENVGAPRESMLNLSRGTQLPYIKNLNVGPTSPIFLPRPRKL